MNRFWGKFVILIAIIFCMPACAILDGSSKIITIVDQRGKPIEGVIVAPPTYSRRPQKSNANGRMHVGGYFLILEKDGYMEQLLDLRKVSGEVVLEPETATRTSDERALALAKLQQEKIERKGAEFYSDRN